MHDQRRRFGMGLAMGLGFLGCSSGDPPRGAGTDGGDAGDTSAAAGDDADETGPGETGSSGNVGTTGDTDLRPNWHEDIAPLVATHCRGCHTGDGLAFSMAEYEATAVWSGSMAAQTQVGLMPPWHAVETDECTPHASFEHDARLSPEQIQMFVDWAELAAPEGDPAKAAPIPEPPSLDLADPNVMLPIGTGVTVEVEGPVLDQFHCFSFDPGNDETVYVDGIQVVPGNAKILHHVLMFVDEDAESAAWEGGIERDCGGGGGISNPQLIGGWVPGSGPIEPPEDVGIRLPAGARIVFNVHYHASASGPETDDSTSLGLRWTTDVPEWVAQFALLGAPGAGQSLSGDFVIPAGEAGHEELLQWHVPDTGGADVRLWSIAHHMHKVAVDARTTITRAGGDDECLLQTPRWDFGWQRLYEYDQPVQDTVALHGGDTITVRCTYDNVITNPQVAEALAEVGLDQPQQVALGEGTLDEMCLAGVGIAVRQ